LVEALRNYRENLSQLLTGASKDVKQTANTVRERIREPHWKQPDFEERILACLATESTPVTRREIFELMEDVMEFESADLQKLKSGRPRWEHTADFAISALARKKLIKTTARNQYIISAEGLNLVDPEYRGHPSQAVS
jgi:hypothetical protein